LLRDDRVPLRHKLMIGALVPYLALPFDLVPDFIPVLGQLDDALLIALVLRRVAKANATLVRELWPGADEGLRVVLGEPGERPR
jgi:uncharacterized membrane protein YkvA (DUF1232 family)